jgi:hypothetical protein
MKYFTPQKLKLFFPSHSICQVKNFILMLNCMLESKTVALSKCKDYVSKLIKNSRLETNSNYVRLIRFFKITNIDAFILGIKHVLICKSPKDIMYLVVDRTNWKFGVKNINLLTIGSLYEGVFMPLHWVQLNKQGNSNFENRRFLIEGLLSIFEVLKKT